MFEEALKLTRELPAGDRDALMVRLHGVRTSSQTLGFGLTADLDSLLADYIRT